MHQPVFNYRKSENFRTPTMFAVFILKFNRDICLEGANRTPNSEAPDQTAPLGAVSYGSAMFAYACLSENLRS